MPEGEPPKSAWAWVYKAATLIAMLGLVTGKLWVSNGFVGKEEYEKDKLNQESRQAIIIKQQQDILLGVNTITTNMDRDAKQHLDEKQDFKELKHNVEQLTQYVYTHPSK